nr:MAG TPA: hypothetical protein [Caudoviricetes sp.]
MYWSTPKAYAMAEKLLVLSCSRRSSAFLGI